MFGAAILFPKTYSRVASLKLGFKNSFKIVLSTMPFTVAAGLLEGFVTRYSPDMPIALNIFIIISTLSLISYYYLIYPFVVHKKLQRNVPAL